MKQTKISVLLASLMAAGLMVSGQALAATDTFTASATLTEAATVTCGTNVSFGTLVRGDDYAGGTVTLNASNLVTVTSGPGLSVGSGAATGKCSVTYTGGNATAALAVTDGSWNSPTLSGVELKSTNDEIMTASLTLSKVSGIGTETLDITGVLTIYDFEANPDGTYTSADVTITVTE